MMCSIGGVIYTEPPTEMSPIISNPAEGDSIPLERDSILRRTMLRAANRGQDSWGVVIAGTRANYEFYGDQGNLSDGLGKTELPILYNDTRVVLFNCRARPVTEVEHALQPAIAYPIVVSHNGLISNDKELAKEYGVSDLGCDTEILARIIAKCFAEDFQGLQEFLTYKVVGSFALAITNLRRPGEIILACNYKPLYVWKHLGLALYFSSLEDQIAIAGGLEANLNLGAPIKLPPYSIARIRWEPTARHWNVRNWSLKRTTPEIKPSRCLVVCSGGLDSTIAAAYMKAVEGFEVDLLHFNYGCKATGQEAIAITKIAGALGSEVYTVPLDLFAKLGQSSLLREDQDVTQGENAAEYATEWVPARNLVMLSIAAAIAESKGYDVVAYGGNLEESGSHPDNEIEMIHRLNDVMPYAVQHQVHVRLDAPLGNLMKTQIIQLGNKIGAPIEHTWSCYSKGPTPCGTCGACIIRAKAFEQCGLEDPSLRVEN